MVAKPSAMNSRPSANLAGLEGLRGPRKIQIQANNGARTMMNQGLIACSTLAGMSQPSTCRSVSRSANRLSDEPACS